MSDSMTLYFIPLPAEKSLTCRFGDQKLRFSSEGSPYSVPGELGEYLLKDFGRLFSTESPAPKVIAPTTVKITRKPKDPKPKEAVEGDQNPPAETGFDANAVADSLSAKELRKMGSDRGLKFPGNMSKIDMATAIQNHELEQAGKASDATVEGDQNEPGATEPEE